MNKNKHGNSRSFGKREIRQTMFDALWLGRKIAEEKQNEMEDVFLGE